jgi:hypothetical protein
VTPIRESRLAAVKYMLTQLLLEETIRRDREEAGTPRRYGERERAAEERVRAAVDRAVESLVVELRSPPAPAPAQAPLGPPTREDLLGDG